MGAASTVLSVDGDPLLALPASEAPVEEWLDAFPIAKLPPLPTRGDGYWSEPFTGILFVGFMAAALVSFTMGAAVTNVEGPTDASTSDLLRAWLAMPLIVMIWTCALVAVFCTAYILLASAGEIRRSERTCYPIPQEVGTRLRSGLSCVGMENIQASDGKSSYCVRCLVWRERGPQTRSHHCNVCQRCFSNFDHHCGVFGRCIVKANMPCFMANVVMLVVGVCIAGATLVTRVGSEPNHPEEQLASVWHLPQNVSFGSVWF
eukprot:TRINITY_DN64622_c0_g1_i1.p1 TRINITY_DN64622_c0_g1~~TRINITY_DN64622_c0_g1_i1.p1  ORF type:complete len:284 (-),score=34.81 TRINITY_DN64622_c0_g1_i1:52-834(-)